MTLKHLLLAATAVAALTGGAAHAMEFNGLTVTGGYDHIDMDDADDMDGVWSRVETGVSFGGLSIDGGLAYSDEGNDTTVFSFAPTYDFGNGITAGAFADKARMDLGSEIEALHYGVTGGFETGALAISAYYGIGDYDVAGDLETEVYGGAANYAFTDTFDAGVFFDREEDDDMRMDAYGLSAGYGFEIAGQALYASANYTEFKDSDASRFGVNFTLPIGGKTDRGVKRLHDHSVAFNSSYITD